jgi:hypothetical protein
MKRDRTKAVADMLLVNKHADEIPFCGEVSPRELNVISTGCGLLQSRRSRHHQLVQASWCKHLQARVERKPSLVWMVLTQNNDVVCSYLDEAFGDSVSVLSRKHRRSPSDDDQGVHRIQS